MAGEDISFHWRNDPKKRQQLLLLLVVLTLRLAHNTLKILLDWQFVVTHRIIVQSMLRVFHVGN
jgi:hypothetical protein